MGMPMSETLRPARSSHDWLTHAGEVAQWVLLLLGWLWLGEQGLRLGWSVASGVLAVSLWWAARLLCRGSDWALNARPTVMAVFGGLSALGVCLPEALRTLDSGTLNLAHAGLLAVALLWGAWSGMVETRSRVSTFDVGSVAWHPVLAALGVGLVGWAPVSAASATGAVSVLLLVCVAVLHARDQALGGAPRACRGQRASLHHVLAPSAMGLMMGGMWLGNVWCAGLGWTTQEMVLWHLVMMAGLPALVALAAHAGASPAASLAFWKVFSVTSRVSASQHNRSQILSELRPDLSLALLALGALMLLGQGAVYGLMAMLLPSLAWAVHCSRPRNALALPVPASPRWRCGMALGVGPGLLLWVGITSPVYGPLAMQTAMALLGTLAAVQTLVLWTRQPTSRPGPPPDHIKIFAPPSSSSLTRRQTP